MNVHSKTFQVARDRPGCFVRSGLQMPDVRVAGTLNTMAWAASVANHCTELPTPWICGGDGGEVKRCRCWQRS